MKSRLSPFDTPSGYFPQAYGFRLFDEAIHRMIKEGIPFSEYEKVMDEIEREMEEEEKKLGANKAKASKVKPGSKANTVDQRQKKATNRYAQS